MGVCASKRSDADIGGQLYVALYDHLPVVAGKLRFRRGDTLVVTEELDRFTLRGHVQGQTKDGFFPVTYAKQTQMASAAPAAAPAVVPELKSWDPKAAATRSAMKGGGARKTERIQIDEAKYEMETYAPLEYERGGDFDPEAASDAWEGEEEEERTRQMEVRWQHFERDLPAGVKCQERTEFERLQAGRINKERREKEQRRLEFLAKRSKQKEMQMTRDERLHALKLARTKRGDTMHKGNGVQRPKLAVISLHTGEGEVLHETNI